jgi:hypothetical protein
VGAVVEILSAEVPAMELRTVRCDGSSSAFLALRPNRLSGRRRERKLSAGHPDLVRALGVFYEALAAQAPADLRFSDPAVAQDQHLDVRKNFIAGLQIA